MFTRCPTCRTLFRIQAQQLKAARGKVRCGECQTTFDALSYLVNYDELSASEQKTISAAEEETQQWQLPFDAPAASSGEDNLSSQQDKEPTASAPPEISPPLPKAPPTTSKAAAAPPKETESAPEEEPSPPPAPVGKAAKPTGLENPVVANPPAPELVTEEAEPATTETQRYILREEEVVQRSLTSRIGWGIATLLMATVLVGQLVFANKDELARDPRWRPWLEQACQLARCTLPVRRDLADIEMIERTVISHPKYQHALLITATLLNKAKFAQPYPQVELTMTDLNQKVVASRRFLPREYLKGSDPTRLFAAGGAVQLQLEITDPGEKAVGFEFNFY